MLNLATMSRGDALHTLKVAQWIEEHKAELEALSQQEQACAVSVEQVQKTFHRQYTELECTRFLPVTISVFTDQNALDQGFVTEPNVLLYQPLDTCKYIVADYFRTQDLGEVVHAFGIEGSDRTWRDVSRKEENSGHS